MNKMNNKIKTMLIGAMAIVGVCSCSEQTPEVFDNIDGIYLNNRSNTNILQDSTNVTFVYQKGDEMQVPVKIQLLGRPSDKAREIALTVTSNDATEGVDYILPEKAELAAGETVLNYMITLKRTAVLKTSQKHLQITLQPNANFTLPVTQETTANGDTVTKNKKGGSIWLEKAIAPTFVNNLVYDCRFGMKQPKKDGADLANSNVAPNYYFASTETGVKQMSKDADLIIWNDTDDSVGVAPA